MKAGKWIFGALASMLVLQAGLAFAEQPPNARKADTKEAFALVVAAVRQEMNPGGRYEFVQGKDLDTVNQRLDDMRSLFDRYGSVDRMDQASKIRLYNDQEWVNGILTHDDANREICRKIAATGTHITQTFCRTYGEIRRQRAGDQSLLTLMQGQNPQRRGSGCRSGKCYQDPMGGSKWAPIGH